MSEMSSREAISWLVGQGVDEATAAEMVESGSVRVIAPKADPVWSARSMLSRTLELVQTGWCQHEQARSRRGIGCEPSAAIARAWSLDGAINLAYAEAVDATLDGLDPTFHSGQCLAERTRLVDALETHLDTDRRRDTASIEYWNDVEGRTQQDVLALCAAVLVAIEARS